jgi:hypothetical protein
MTLYGKIDTQFFLSWYFWVTLRYLWFFFKILDVNFYYIINKLIILIFDSRLFDTSPPLKVYLNCYFSIFKH